jgi:cobalt-zinc-cadmium efflux system membrane fusion protein
MRLGGGYLWAGLVVGLLIIGALYAGKAGWFGGKDKAEEAPPAFQRQQGKIFIPKDSPLRSRIVTAAAGSREIGAKLVVPGIVEVDPARSDAVLTPLAGRLVELKVGLGDRVDKGQVVAVLQSPDLAQAYDDDDKAADALKLANDRDQARSNYAQAKAEFVRTQARLKAVGAVQAGVEQPRLLTVHAPLAGSVIALSVAPGNMINDPTQPLMTIAALDPLWVTAMVPEKLLAEVTKGQSGDIAFDAYPGQVRHGTVAFVADLVDPDSRRDRVRFVLANPGLALKPNMFATVTLVGRKKSQVVLPTSALLMNNDRTTVFVQTGEWTFERRIVEPLLEDGPEVAIAAGVAAGDQVVVKGGILLND